MKLFPAAVAAAAIAAVVAAPSVGIAGCKLQAIAEYRLTMSGGEALVDAEINGQPIRLLLDTGASSSVITPAASLALHMPHELVQGIYASNADGTDEADVAIAEDFKLGDRTSHQVPFIVALGNLKSDTFQGRLGEDFLAQSDLELDFAGGFIRLFKPSGCVGDQVVYWGAAYSTVPIQPSNDPTDLNIDVAFGTHRELASLDTAASTTVVTPNAAAQLGVVPPGSTAATYAVFPNFSIGGEMIRSPKLNVQDLSTIASVAPVGSLFAQKADIRPDLLLGADFVQAHRIYIARSQGLIYFSYVGGPVFRTPDQPTTPSPQAARPGLDQALPHP